MQTTTPTKATQPTTAPLHAPTHQLITEALRGLTPTPEVPSWSHRLLPATVRNLLADLGWWTNPAAQKPSQHLEQALATLHRYGWCQTALTNATGRLCIEGAMRLLENTGHVTPDNRARAEQYMQSALAEIGVRMHYQTWNDLPDQTPTEVANLLVRAAALARREGE